MKRARPEDRVMWEHPGMRWFAGMVVGATVGAIAACGGDDDGAPMMPMSSVDLCSAAELGDALAAARAGDVIGVGRCRVAGSFVVPAGVTLRGVGAESVLVAEGGRGVVALSPAASDPPTRLASLAIEGDGRSAVSASGAGSVVIEDVSVATVRGAGIGVREVTSLAMSRVDVTGPVTRENVADLPLVVVFDTHATHGIVLVDVADAALAEVTVSGLADTAVYASESTLRWMGGAIRESRGIGLYASGGEVTLEGVELCGMIRADGAGLLESFAAVLRDGVIAETRDVVVCDNDRYGIVQVGSTATHAGMRASRNGTVAIWAQESATLAVESASTFENNVEAGIVVLDSPGARIADTTVSDTQPGRRPNPDQPTAGPIDLGDGIQLLRSASGSVLQGLTLEANTRVGLFVSAESRAIDVAITDVTVDGSDDELGAIADDGDVVHPPGSGWDEGVTRRGATIENDAAQADLLDAVGIIGPCMVPPPDLAAVGEATE